MKPPLGAERGNNKVIAFLLCFIEALKGTAYDFPLYGQCVCDYFTMKGWT
jgi:hypothetical protein